MNNKLFISSDQHFMHENAIRYCNRPFSSVEEMNHVLITRHNYNVQLNDLCYILGDFSLGSLQQTCNIIEQLNGNLVFIPGSHDYWMQDIYDNHYDLPLSKNGNEIVITDKIHEFKCFDKYVVLSHYAMRTWPRSHYNSYQFYGHSHGTLPDFNLSTDVGVDRWNYEPIELKWLLYDYKFDYKGK